mmetsp:Transcript_29609/g.58966  ORF Transcript_29609/g.58966 Transcript_29609/m.58966 type:complete len:244 (+) Transcript_29609:190-921(+)
MLKRACVMESTNLPPLQDPQRDYTLEKACTTCPNCPPNGGPCLHGFSRELSLMCAVCPQDTTEIGGSCQTCPSNTLLANLTPVIALSSLLLLGTLVYLLSKRWQNRVPKFKFNLRKMIQLKQLGAAFQILQVFGKLSQSLPEWYMFLSGLYYLLSASRGRASVHDVVRGAFKGRVLLYEVLGRHGFLVHHCLSSAKRTPPHLRRPTNLLRFDLVEHAKTCRLPRHPGPFPGPGDCAHPREAES